MSTNNCISGTCLKFDGANDYINCGSVNNFNFLAPITISAWIKTSLVAAKMIVSKETDYDHKDWQFEVFTNGELGFEGQAFYRIGTTNIANGKWNYVLARMSAAGSTNVDLYVNGNKENYTLTGSTGNLGTNSAAVFIGARYTTPTSFFNGLIDDVRIYNQAVSSSQIKNNYYIGLNKLFKNNQIFLDEFNQKISELKNNLTKN